MNSQSIVDDQERRLTSLSEGLVSLRKISKTIGDESTLHSRLLDSLDDHVQDGNIALIEETDRAEYLNMRRTTCWLWTIISILIISLIMILVS
jgi:SYP5 family syntaxin